MKNDVHYQKEKKHGLKLIVKGANHEKKHEEEKNSNSKGLCKKDIDLYIALTYEQIINSNKKKYRNLKIKKLKNTLNVSLKLLQESIEMYKELINRTEFWERKSTYDFNFKDWTTLKKANGKLTRYYNDIKGISQKIESEEL